VRRTIVVVAVLAALAMLAACSGNDESTVSSKRASRALKRSATTTSTVPAPPTVQVADTSLGAILVDGKGLTLYQLDADSATAVTCESQCAATWPPLVVKGTPVAGEGIDASLLSTIDGPNGKQATYAGHPLYTFSGDQAPGQVNGFGTGGVWWVLGADGAKIAPPPPPPDTQARSAPTSPPTAAPEPPPPPPPPSMPAPLYGY
jgi:predicted lipoprotein with Yx(FWY)xxD motif